MDRDNAKRQQEDLLQAYRNFYYIPNMKESANALHFLVYFLVTMLWEEDDLKLMIQNPLDNGRIYLVGIFWT